MRVTVVLAWMVCWHVCCSQQVGANSNRMPRLLTSHKLNNNNNLNVQPSWRSTITLKSKNSTLPTVGRLINARQDRVTTLKHTRWLTTQKYYVETKTLNQDRLMVFSNDNDSDITACDLSAVLSYRERIDPVHKILQTRLSQEHVCHFHLVVIIWDVPWAAHQFAAYYQVLENRPRTTILLHRGSLSCYACLRNLALPYIQHTSFTVWSDHGALWKKGMMARLWQTARTDPRHPALVSPYVAELERHDGRIMDWSDDRARTMEDEHHPQVILKVYNSGHHEPAYIRTSRTTQMSSNASAVQILSSDLTEPHVYMTNNKLCSSLWPHDERGGHARTHHFFSLPVLRMYGRNSQLADTGAEAAYPIPEAGCSAADALAFIWQWEPLPNIQSAHVTNAINGYMDLDYRCLHSDLLFRLRNAGQITTIPNDRSLHMALIIAQLAMGFWNQFCLVGGSTAVSTATAPQRLPPGSNFECEQWFDMSEALGWLPFMSFSGLLFRSNYQNLYSVPFNMTAAEQLKAGWGENLRKITPEHAQRFATGLVETACLGRRHTLVVISGFDAASLGHARLLNRLSPLASLQLEYIKEIIPTTTADASNSNIGPRSRSSSSWSSSYSPTLSNRHGQSPNYPRVQLWLLVKTRDRQDVQEHHETALMALRSLLDKHVRRAGQDLQTSYIDPTGDPRGQYLYNIAAHRVSSFQFRRLKFTELEDALTLTET
eukprot:m.117087 g.117087  ORF g.117087 m.117087 type:complete len:715 (+) comp15414_c0_seq1:404-2548(+)